MKPSKAPSKKTARKRTAKKATKKTAKKAAKKAAKSKGGRPTAYKPEYCELAKNYCLLGAIDTDLARFFGVVESTINKWKIDFPEFSESLKEGREMADSMVAQRLFTRAIGYSHVDTKFATFEGQITDAKEYIKHYAPDTVACIFWLKNRRPDLWRDKQEIESTSKKELVIPDEVQDRLVDAMKHAANIEAPAAFKGNSK